MKSKILITGGNGLVGRNLIEHEKAKAFQIFAPTRRDLDLTNAFEVAAYIREVKPDLVIHAAGKVGGIQANMAQPVEFLVENMDMGRNIVLAAKAEGVKQLINLGSSCMYPRFADNPLREETILSGELEPTNEGYALAKIMVSRLCQYITEKKDGYNYKTIIPCNLYGRFDKFHPKHSHLVPAILHKLYEAKSNNADEVEIWGDGTARREFMYAGDLADFLWEAVRRFESLPQVMNVGCGYDESISGFYYAAADVVGYRGKFVYDKSRPSGMKKKQVDVSKLAAWGWVAKTSLAEGMRISYEYYLKIRESEEFK